MSNTGEEPAQQWTIYENRSIRARFLTAIASNTEAVVVFRRLGLVTSVPINSLWFDRTHCNAGTTNSAFRSINDWSLGYSIFDESSKSPTRTMHWGFSIYFKTWVEEGFYAFANKFNILYMVCSQSCLFTWFGCRDNFGIKINYSASCCI